MKEKVLSKVRGNLDSSTFPRSFLQPTLGGKVLAVSFFSSKWGYAYAKDLLQWPYMQGSDDTKCTLM